MLFEIHITGLNSFIIDEFKSLGYKFLSVNLLNKENKIVGKEHICAIQNRFKNYEQCLEFTLDLVSKLKNPVIRVKIECPFNLVYLN